MKKNKIISKLLCTMMMTTVLSTGIYLENIPSAEALGVGDIGSLISLGSQYSQERAALKKQLELIDTTPEGQEAVLQEIMSRTGTYYNPELNAKLDKMMKNLIEAIGKTDSSVYDLPYKYYLNPDDSLNAFCTLAHVVSVNRGSFAYLTNEDELAAVLSHEIGHGQKHHVANSTLKTYDKAFLAQAGSTALGGGDVTQAILTQTFASSVIHHNKADEKEADALAWEYMTHSNYNPGACAAVMQKFLEVVGDDTKTGVDLWFNPSDHPNTMSRRDRYVKDLEKYSNNHVKAQDGKVTVNGKAFVTPAAISSMSTPERSYFVMGNLAAAYHNGHNKDAATVDGRTVKLGVQPIITCTAEDEDPQVLADRLNSIK